MDGSRGKLDIISSYLLRYLENTFRQMKLSGPFAEAGVQLSTDERNSAYPQHSGKLSAEQWSILKNRLLQLAVQLPSQLFNTGITDALLPPDNIHVAAYKRYVCVQVDGYGLMIIDLKEKKFHARLWEAVPLKARAPLKEVHISGSTHKRNLNTDFDFTSAIDRDKDYVTSQFKEFLNKEGIPTSEEDLIPGVGIKVDWLKHKALAKKLGPLHEAYKSLIKTPTYKGIMNDSPVSALYDIGTARQGVGNLPGVDAVPGGKQLVDIMANDQFRKDDLLFVDVAQKTPASDTDAAGNPNGGYSRLINAMRSYNDNNWGDSFQGVYLHEEELQMIEKIKFIIPKNMRFNTSFTERPSDQQRKPYEFFMYIRSGQLGSEYLTLDEVGVIYVNPAK